MYFTAETLRCKLYSLLPQVLDQFFGLFGKRLWDLDLDLDHEVAAAAVYRHALVLDAQ